MIHILYEITYPWDSHQNRAESLVQSIGGSCCNVDDAPYAINGLDTLIFWGHGTLAGLCGKPPEEIKKIVRDWKVLNPKIATVEVITCNARHGTNTLEPYIDRLKTALHGTSFRSKTRGMVLKSVPVNAYGAANGYSILLADWQSKSWCYITAHADERGGDSHMMDAKLEVCKIAQPFGDNLAIAAPKLEAQYHGRGRDKKFTLNYGLFPTLRSLLSPV